MLKRKGGGGLGTPLGFLRRLGLKTGIDFSQGYGIGYGFRQNYGSVWKYLSFQFQVNKKEIEICEFEMHLKKFFVCALI